MESSQRWTVAGAFPLKTPRHVMSCLRLFLALIAISGWARILAAEVAPESLSVEVVPATITLPRFGEQIVVVIARNHSDATLSDVQISWNVAPGFEMASQPFEKRTLAPHAATRWDLRIAQKGTALGGGHADVFVAFAQASATPGEAAATSVASAAVVLEQQKDVDLNEVLELRCESSLSSLQEYRDGKVFVVLRNKGTLPLSIKFIKEIAPADVDAAWVLQPVDVALAPLHEQSFELRLRAKDAIQPGKHLVLFLVSAEWTQDDIPRTGSRILKYEFEAGVIGESEILTAVGVPTFLLLPGFLAIVIFLFCWNHIAKRKPIEVDLKGGTFWALSITLSLLAMTIYPALTHRDYLSGYGLKDIKFVWFGASLVGAVACLIFVGIGALWNAAKRQAARRNTFSPDDTEQDVVEKLSKMGGTLRLPQADVKISGQTARVFILQQNVDGKTSWVAPEIQLTINLLDDGNERGEVEAQILEVLASETTGASQLVKLLRENGSSLPFALKWVKSQTVVGVTQVSKPTPVPGLRSIVQLEE